MRVRLLCLAWRQGLTEVTSGLSQPSCMSGLCHPGPEVPQRQTPQPLLAAHYIFFFLNFIMLR